MLDDLKLLVGATDDTLQGKRDRAMLLLAFSGMLRTGEVGKINVTDLREVGKRGYVLNIRKSKTHQSGQGQEIAIPHGKIPETCPVIAIKAYIAAAGIDSGPLIHYVDRHGNLGTKGITRYSVVGIIRRVATAAGFEDIDTLSGHSLRSGLASAAAFAGTPTAVIQLQGRWKTARMVDRYVRDVRLFDNNAATSAGL